MNLSYHHTWRGKAILLGALIAGTAGCGSNSESGTNLVSTTVGSTGGTVALPGGPTVQIPASALASSTVITIEDTGQTGAAGGRIYSFGPSGTTFSQAVTVEIPVGSGVTTPTIYWTKAGSTTLYDALPTSVSGSTASAHVNHFSLGYVGSAPAAATPVFTPVAGAYGTAQSVTISSATASATIFYTTNGSTPTTSSTLYTGPVAVTATTTLQAIATATGYTQSAVGSATYTITGTLPVAATPVFTPAAGSYSTAQSVTISSATASATIFYTTNGSTPTTSSTLYTGPVAVTATTTLQAIATATGYTQSAVGSATYTITGTLPVAATPAFSPAAGSYSTAQSVNISSATASATIFYTTNGSTPTPSSTIYTGPVAVTATTTLQAIATATGYTQSAVGSATYTIGGGGGPSFATVCQDINNSILNLFSTCLHANPALFSSLNTDVQLSCNEGAKAITAGRATYNPAQGAACQSALVSITCDTLDTGVLVPSCLAALTGNVTGGGTCWNDIECAAGTCSSTAAACPSTCAAYATLGQSCASATCSPELVCDVTCKAPSAVGGTCPCQASAWCATGSGCAARQTSGACNPASLDQCALGYTCAGTAGSETCQRYVDVGGACAPSADLCGPGYVCTGSTCASYPTLGQACSSICLGSYCDFLGSHTCLALKAVGATCLLPTECSSGDCNSGVCAINYCAEP